MRGNGEAAAVGRVGYVAYALHLWTVFGLFLLFFVGGLAVVAWMLRIYFRGGRGDSAS